MWPVLPAYRGRLFHRLLSLSLTTSVCESPCVCLTAVWINSQSCKQSSDSLSRDSSKDAFSFPFLFTHNRNVHVQKKRKENAYRYKGNAETQALEGTLHRHARDSWMHTGWVLWLEKSSFLMLQFILIFRLTHKNIVQYHSYFRGHLQNQLSARGHLRLHLRLCVCGLEFPVTEIIRPTSLFCFGVVVFFHFVFLLSLCQGHMTAIWPHWWPINHAVRLYKAAE